MALLSIEGLSKSFGALQVLNNLSFEVEQGSVFGFIGKNGSGKTTTMKIIVGLLKAQSGSVHISGVPVKYGETKTNHMIGYLPDVPEYYGFFNAIEYLRLVGQIANMSPAKIKSQTSELLELVGLQDSAKRKIRGYSRGMKQRLGIAQALIHEPTLLICDEPTSALDPQGRSDLLGLLELVRQRTTVLLSTHILTDVERVCDAVGVLDGGKLALYGKLDELKAAHRRDTIVIEMESAAAAQRLAQPLLGLPFVQQVGGGGNTLTIDVHNVTANGRDVLAFLSEQDSTVRAYHVLEPSLESLYLDVIA
ncbi:MAG: ABC transporter ATP-binding protein [Coriobacteriales bacterium]|nr:ABC transporter ATP-binding protein [Coriobacteriales bacterium]